MDRRFLVYLLLGAVSSFSVIGVAEAAPYKNTNAKSSAVAGKVRVDQSSKAAVMRTFVCAVLTKDAAVLDKIFSPGIKAMLKGQAPNGDYKPMLPELLDSIHSSLCKEYKITDVAAVLRDRKLIDKIAQDGDKQTGGKSAVQINGKWYVSLGMDEPAAAPAAKAGKAGSSKGFADQHAAATAFVDAVVNDDIKAFLNTLSPETQAEIDKLAEKKNDQFPTRTVAVVKLMEGMREMLQYEFKLKDIKEVNRNKSLKEDVVRSLFKGSRPPFKEINGRWYVHFGR